MKKYIFDKIMKKPTKYFKKAVNINKKKAL